MRFPSISLRFAVLYPKYCTRKLRISVIVHGIDCHFKPEIHGRRLLIYAMKAVCVSSALARLTGRTVPSDKVTLVRLQI